MAKDSNLTGKVALVTGATRGLGLEISRQLAKRGAHVIVAGRDLSRAEAIAQELGHAATPLQLDTASETDRAAALVAIDARHGRLDILVNNAGVLLDGGVHKDSPPSEAYPQTLREIYEVNFFAPVFLTQALLPLLRRSQAAHVINISSNRGSIANMADPGAPTYPHRTLGYNSSKAALNAFTVLLAEELRGTGVKVNAVHPGWVRTDMGGGDADLSVEESASAILRYADLGLEGPTGGYFFGPDRLPW
jgi:NAD(P)-dependent dehydrogenase (short-subunit alcohol dehydrogenase family)